MRNVPSLPWWGWALIAFFVLNVVLRMDVSIFVPLLIGMVAAGVLGQRHGVGGGGADPSGQLPPPESLPPGRPADPSTPGWADGPGTAAQPPPSPADPPGPGSSPWVHGSGQPPPGTSGAGTPGRGTDPDPDAGMPRIEVPQYPHGATPSSGYPTSGTNPATDPAVSLGQLHLSRCSRDLHAAATTGSSADVARVLAEVGDQAERLLTQLGGSGAMPGSGRREFEAGLRRLHRDVLAARGEDPPGAKVSRVVQAAGRMGQTGLYE